MFQQDWFQKPQKDSSGKKEASFKFFQARWMPVSQSTTLCSCIIN